MENATRLMGPAGVRLEVAKPPVMPSLAQTLKSEGEKEAVMKVKEAVMKVKEAKKASKKAKLNKPPRIPKPKKAKKITGPGTKKFKFKAKSGKGECDVLGCKAKARTPRAFRCAKHTKEIRTAQLKANNVVWMKRVQKHTAGHHLSYRGRPTAWARLKTPMVKATSKPATKEAKKTA